MSADGLTIDAAEFMAADGAIEPERLRATLRISNREIAAMLGLPEDSISKRARAMAPATQRRLREVVDILTQVKPWSGTWLYAYAWFRSQNIPSFGTTAEHMVRMGHADAVKQYIERVAGGGFS